MLPYFVTDSGYLHYGVLLLFPRTMETFSDVNVSNVKGKKQQMDKIITKSTNLAGQITEASFTSDFSIVTCPHT